MYRHTGIVLGWVLRVSDHTSELLHVSEQKIATVVLGNEKRDDSYLMHLMLEDRVYKIWGQTSTQPSTITPPIPYVAGNPPSSSFKQVLQE